MSRDLKPWEVNAVALLLVIGGLLCVVYESARAGPPQAPRASQAPPVDGNSVSTKPKTETKAARFYNVRQSESGRWFAVVSTNGLYPEDEVWDVLDKLNKDPKPQKVKSKGYCGCSSSCTCGCQQGEPCTCDKAVSAVNTRQMQQDLTEQRLQVEVMLQRGLYYQRNYTPLPAYTPYVAPVNYQSPISYGGYTTQPVMNVRRGGSC